MAGTTATNTPQSWDDVNQLLRQLGENKRRQVNTEQKFQEATERAKTAYEAEITPLKKEAAQLLAKVRKYATTHLKNTKGGRSKRLLFGTVAWRKDSQLVVPKGTDKAVIAKLKKLGYSNCFTVTETLNREEIKKLPETVQQQLGVYIKPTDTFNWTTGEKLPE